jgi:hypothetical protein
MSGWDEMISRLDQTILPGDERDLVWWLAAAVLLFAAVHLAERGVWKKIGKWLEYMLSERCPRCGGIEFKRVKLISAANLAEPAMIVWIWAYYCPDCKRFFQETEALELP